MKMIRDNLPPKLKNLHKVNPSTIFWFFINESYEMSVFNVLFYGISSLGFLYSLRFHHFLRVSWTGCLFGTLPRGPQPRSCSSIHFFPNLALLLVSFPSWGKTAWDECKRGIHSTRTLCLSQSTEPLRKEAYRKVQLCSLQVSDQVFEKTRLASKSYKHCCWLELRPLERTKPKEALQSQHWWFLH